MNRRFYSLKTPSPSVLLEKNRDGCCATATMLFSMFHYRHHKLSFYFIMRQPKAKSTKTNCTEIESLISEGNGLQLNDPNLIPFSVATSKSTAYVLKQNHDELAFEQTLIKHNNAYYTKLFSKDKFGIGLFYHLVSDNHSSPREHKTKLFSDVLKTFAIIVKNKRNGESLEPSTTNAFVRRFLAHCKDKYNISMSLKTDFNFPGGLTGLLYRFTNVF